MKASFTTLFRIFNSPSAFVVGVMCRVFLLIVINKHSATNLLCVYSQRDCVMVCPDFMLKRIRETFFTFFLTDEVNNTLDMFSYIPILKTKYDFF